MGRIVSLRTHSWYSLLEGVSSPQALLERAAEAGYQALALTDCNSLAGTVDFAEAAQRVGVRPILGAHVRLQNQRATLLIAEPSGYRSLCQILGRLHFQSGNSLAQILAGAAEGLHVLVDDSFLLKPPLTDAFRGRLWLELVRPGKTESGELALLDSGNRLGLRPVATTGAFFAAPSGHGSYRLLAAVRQKVSLDQLPARLPVVSANHLAGEAELRERFRDVPNALANAVTLAEMCRSDVLPRGTVLPPVKLPTGQDAQTQLRLLCERGLRQREWRDGGAVGKRLERELALIAQRDLAAYFLAVADIAGEARRQGWPLALRGSAGSSLVCHLLGITDVDPMAHGLRVERFLHEGRDGLPDIDLDLASQNRRHLWNTILTRFGKDHVARVGVIEHFGAKSAFLAAALAHGLTEPQAAALRDELGDDLETLADGTDGSPLALAPPGCPLEPAAWPRLVQATRVLLGRPRALSTHPAGIVLTAEPAERLLPVEKGPGGARVAQFDKDAIERVGCVKLDLLSNRALSVIAEARQHARQLAPEDEGRAAEDGDPATLALLAAGGTLGVGQLETPAARRLLRQVAPRGIQDLAQALAILRPGPASGGGKDSYVRRRRGLEPPRYTHASLEGLLRESHGLLLFEDDALSVIETLTGLPATEADHLRRRLADPDDAREVAASFLAACERNSIPRPAAEEALGQLQRQADYTFCKSHAVSCALIAWQQAWLKAHHPGAFWTAVFNNHAGHYPMRVYAEEVKRAGLQLLPPCINRSHPEWTQEVSGLRIGLRAVRSLSPGAVALVIEERERGGPFAGLSDLRRRVALTAPDLALLIRCGALDFTGRGRQALLREADVALLGRMPLRWREEVFEPWPLADLLSGHALAWPWQAEWELLGFCTGPPLLALVRPLLSPSLVDSRALAELAGKRVRLAGLLSSVKESAEGEVMRLTLEDEWGMVEIFTAAQAEPDRAALGSVVVAEGQAEDLYGAPALATARLESPLVGGALGSWSPAVGKNGVAITASR
jgi:DNA-directed DNA polymerase III PolC